MVQQQIEAEVEWLIESHEILAVSALESSGAEWVATGKVAERVCDQVETEPEEVQGVASRVLRRKLEQRD